jgi:type VI secretion system secreted protein Hcp
MRRLTADTAVRRVCLVTFTLALGVAYPASIARGAEPKQTAGVFLELEGIPGESADAKYQGQIDVQSFSLSAQRGGEGENAKTNFNDFFILKPYDAASPALLVACGEGRTIAHAVLTVRGSSAGGEPREYLKYTFTDLTVSRINQVVGGGGAQEELNFRYGSVVIEYTLPDGKVVRRGWDVKAGKQKEGK